MPGFLKQMRLAAVSIAVAVTGIGVGYTGSAKAQSPLAPTAQAVVIPLFLDSVLVSVPNGLNFPAVGGLPGLTVPAGGTISMRQLALYVQALRAHQIASFQQAQAAGFPQAGFGISPLSTEPGTTVIPTRTLFGPPTSGSVSDAMWRIPFSQESFLTILRINSLDPEERNQVLERLSTVPSAGPGSGGFTHASNLSSQLGQRLALLRNDGTETVFADLKLAGTQLASSSTTPGAVLAAYERAKEAADAFPLVSGFALPDEIGVFVSGNVSFGDSDALGGTEDFTTGSVTAGADLRVTPTIVVGIAGTYSDTTTDVSFGGGTESETAGGSLYGTWYKNNWYTDIYAGLAATTADIRRFVPIGPTSLESKARTHGTVLTTGGRVGRNFTEGDLTIGPFATLDYVRTKTDDYTETGAGAFSLMVPETTATSLRASLGGQAAMAFKLGSNDLAPYAQAAWVREFHDDAPITTVAFSGAPTATFQSVGRSSEANWAQIGVGASARFSDSLLLNVGANTDLGRGDVRRTQISLSLRAAF